MKLELKIVIVLFVFLLIVVLLYHINKQNEGLCDASCNVKPDCSGSDLSNCLIGLNSKKCPVPADSIKCIADFGTAVGDPLCCGQEGVLQDTRYVCPNTLKKCSNFKCGSAFGSCVSKGEKDSDD